MNRIDTIFPLAKEKPQDELFSRYYNPEEALGGDFQTRIPDYAGDVVFDELETILSKKKNLAPQSREDVLKEVFQYIEDNFQEIDIKNINEKDFVGEQCFSRKRTAANIAKDKSLRTDFDYAILYRSIILRLKIPSLYAEGVILNNSLDSDKPDNYFPKTHSYILVFDKEKTLIIDPLNKKIFKNEMEIYPYKISGVGRSGADIAKKIGFLTRIDKEGREIASANINDYLGYVEALKKYDDTISEMRKDKVA